MNKVILAALDSYFSHSGTMAAAWRLMLVNIRNKYNNNVIKKAISREVIC